MEAGKVVGYLYGYGDDLRSRSPGRAALFTGGKGPDGRSKILWFARGGQTSLSVTGVRLDGSGKFARRFPEVGVANSRGGSYHASIIDLPSAGCWRLTVRSLRAQGRFALLGIAP